MQFLAPLFAGPIDWIVFLVPIVFAIVWMLNQALGKANAPPPRPRPGMPRPPNPAMPRAPQQPANVNQEIEDFLRRAAQARAQAAQPQAPAQPAPRPAQAAPRTLVQTPRAPMPSRRPELVAAEIVDDEGPTVKGSVAEHVQRHLDNRAFAERASHLSKVDNADELMQGHLKQVFEHPVGSLASQQAGAESQPGKVSSASPQIKPVLPATEIAAIFRDPKRIRQAVILTEILAPREFR